MIRMHNVEKFYKTGSLQTFVLRRINLEIQEGEFVTIMGPSGAGKTTLLSILGMLDASWAGEYWLLDQPVHELKTKQRAALNKPYIGFDLQRYFQINSLTLAT